MPAPDPFAIYPVDREPGQIGQSACYVLCGNDRHRGERVRRILDKIRLNGWACACCGGPVPLWRRADAVYCSTGCRKRAMRLRKALTE